MGVAVAAGKNELILAHAKPAPDKTDKARKARINLNFGLILVSPTA
jgi:hypothetical protein